ncbi:hypothetical protein [Aureliella helgolandensis]|uniref:hypothetical protein n=1 Tax=Aureliella helgolandensis TaxID=2527968 RepID=UPI0011A91A7D|nr:hypothetical protein [Aureliella helgolandensis]
MTNPVKSLDSPTVGLGWDQLVRQSLAIHEAWLLEGNSRLEGSLQQSFEYLVAAHVLLTTGAVTSAQRTAATYLLSRNH